MIVVRARQRSTGRWRSRGSLLLALSGILVLVSACGGTASPTPATASASGASSASSGATPRPTAWPGNAVVGIEALGVADGEIRRGIADFSQGVASEDLALMRRAADGLAGVDVLLSNADRIDIFSPMQPLAAELRVVLPAISGASEDLRTAIDAGDAEAIPTASARLAVALTAYAELQPTLAGFVLEAIEQRRLLVN